MKKKVIRGILVRGARGRWDFDLVCARSGRRLFSNCKSAWANSYRRINSSSYYTVHCQDDPATAMQLREERNEFPIVVIEATSGTRDADRHDYSHPVNIRLVQPTGRGGTPKNAERADTVEVKALAQLSREHFEL